MLLSGGAGRAGRLPAAPTLAPPTPTALVNFLIVTTASVVKLAWAITNVQTILLFVALASVATRCIQQIFLIFAAQASAQ